MSELSSSSASGASDYDQISGIEPLSQSSASESLHSSSQLKAQADEKYLTTGRLSENKVAAAPGIPLNKPQEKKVKAYFTKSSTVIQYTTVDGVEAVPVVKASLSGVKNPPASWTAVAGESSSQGSGRPKGARVKLFQASAEAADTSASETSGTIDPSMDGSGQDHDTSQQQHGTSEVVIIPSEHNGDDNQSLSSIDQAINQALERAHTELESEEVPHDLEEDDEGSQEQEISQNSFSSSSRNDSAMDESIDRSDFEGAQAIADEYILQTRGYQPDISDEEASPAVKGRDHSEFSALHLEVSSTENSNVEPPDLQLRPYRYSDCSDTQDQSENAEADQYQAEADQRDSSGASNDGVPSQLGEMDTEEESFPVRLPATGMSDSISGGQTVDMNFFQARLQSMLVEAGDGRQDYDGNDEDADTSDDDDNEEEEDEHSQDYVNVDPASYGQGVDPRMLQQSLAIAQAMARSAPDGGDEMRHTTAGPMYTTNMPQHQLPQADMQIGRGAQRAPKMGVKGLKAVNQGAGRVNAVQGVRVESGNIAGNQVLAQKGPDHPQQANKSGLPQRVKGSTAVSAEKQKSSVQHANSTASANPSGKSTKSGKAGGKSANSSIHSHASEGSVRQSRPSQGKGKQKKAASEPQGSRQQPTGDTATVRKNKNQNRNKTREQQSVPQGHPQHSGDSVAHNLADGGEMNPQVYQTMRPAEMIPAGEAELTPPRQAPRAQQRPLQQQHMQMPPGQAHSQHPQHMQVPLGQPHPQHPHNTQHMQVPPGQPHPQQHVQGYMYMPPHGGLVGQVAPGPYPLHHHGDESLDLSPIAAMSEASARFQRESPGAASAREMLQNLSLVSHQAHDRETTDVSGVSTNDIANMEDLRHHLQGMLKLSSKVLPGKSEYDETNEVDDLIGGKMFDTQSMSSVNSVPYFSGQSFSNMSTQLEDLLGEKQRNLARAAGIQGSHGNHGAHVAGRDLPSMLAELQAMSQRVEKEKFRRKHCEKQIQETQNEILQLQQQLAVAVSTDRKKDFMIEQLDKTLAKVIDGWKRKETNKQETINELAQENAHLKEVQEQQKQLIDQFERELSQTVDELAAERQTVKQTKSELEQQLKDQETERSRLLKALESERERVHTLEVESSVVTEQRDKLKKQFKEIQQNYDQDQVVWNEKEAEYTKTIDEITEQQINTLEQEKTRFEKQESVLHDVQRVLTATQTETAELNIQLDTVCREKESMKVEMGLLEARGDSNLRKLETELKSQAEQELGEKLEETHAKFVKSEETTRERHRQQITELTRHHSKEMEAALTRYHEDTRRLEDKHLSQTDEYEERIDEFQSEMRQLKSQNRTLEAKWNEVTNKLQSLMQQNCNEALKLLKSDTSGLLYALSPAKPPQPNFTMLLNSTAGQRGDASSTQSQPPTQLNQPENMSHYSRTTGNFPGDMDRSSVLSADVTASEGGFRPLQVDQSAVADPDLSQYSLGGMTQFDNSMLNSTVLSQATAKAHDSVYNSTTHSLDPSTAHSLDPSTTHSLDHKPAFDGSFLGQGRVALPSEPAQNPNANVSQESVQSRSQSEGRGQDVQAPPSSVYQSSSFQQFQQLFSQAYSQAQASITGFSLPEPITSQGTAAQQQQPIAGQISSLPMTFSSQQAPPPRVTSVQGQAIENPIPFGGQANQGQMDQGQGYPFGSSFVLHPPVHLAQSTNFDAMGSMPTANYGPGFPSYPPSPAQPPANTAGDWQAPQRDPGAVGQSAGQSFLSNLLQQAGDTPTSTSQNGNTSYGTNSNGTQESDGRSENLDFMNNKMVEHEHRQNELQHYIKMLLNKSPGSTTQDQQDADETNSNVGIYDNRNHVVDTSQLAFSKTTVAGHVVDVEGRPVAAQNESTPKAKHPVPKTGGLTPEHAGEIARLLGLYRQGPVAEGDNMEAVMGYLQGVQNLNESMQPTHDRTPPTKGTVKKRTGRSPSPSKATKQPGAASPKGTQQRAKRNLDMGATKVIKIPTGDGPSVPKQKAQPQQAAKLPAAVPPKPASNQAKLASQPKVVQPQKAVSFQPKVVQNQPTTQTAKKPERKVAAAAGSKSGKGGKAGVWK